MLDRLIPSGFQFRFLRTRCMQDIEERVDFNREVYVRRTIAGELFTLSLFPIQPDSANSCITLLHLYSFSLVFAHVYIRKCIYIATTRVSEYLYARMQLSKKVSAKCNLLRARCWSCIRSGFECRMDLVYARARCMQRAV